VRAAAALGGRFMALIILMASRYPGKRGSPSLTRV
jgi:hypothetical protein